MLENKKMLLQAADILEKYGIGFETDVSEQVCVCVCHEVLTEPHVREKEVPVAQVAGVELTEYKVNPGWGLLSLSVFSLLCVYC